MVAVGGPFENTGNRPTPLIRVDFRIFQARTQMNQADFVFPSVLADNRRQFLHSQLDPMMAYRDVPPVAFFFGCRPMRPAWCKIRQIVALFAVGNWACSSWAIRWGPWCGLASR